MRENDIRDPIKQIGIFNEETALKYLHETRDNTTRIEKIRVEA